MSLPTNEQLAKIDEAIEAAGATGSTARGLTVKAFANDEFSLAEGEETIASWLAVQQVENAKMFPKANVKANGNDNADNKPSPSNPFSRSGWNITEQGRLVKVNPKMAASLSAACGVKIGATKPNL